MILALILKGMLAGMINAAPLGPVGLLCLRKNMVLDRLPGLFSGMGMAVAYGIISFCVVYGLKAIPLFLHEHVAVFQIGGGLLLVLMGCFGLRSPVPKSALVTPASVGCLGEFLTSFAMTLLNPVPFTSFTVILTSFQIFRGHPDLVTDLTLAVSVLSGTFVFWLPANEALHHAKMRSADVLSRRVGTGTSIALLVFGVMIAVKGLL